MEHDDISGPLKRVINESPSGRVDRVESRACSSDKHSGVEYSIYGDTVPVNPIIYLVSKIEYLGIESITYYNEHYNGEPHLSVFIATLPKKKYSAFVS